jgi:AAA domain, putative AbiEii toxin, Type IV TA system
MTSIEKQGDGMRAFATVVLNTLLNNRCLTLIDEPEAFLHPPQARTLGFMIAKEFPKNRQAVIATHSGDIVRGLLEGDPERIKVLQLSNHEPQKVWNDPILYHSNILDGLFHEKVVVCEADTDCRFYSAILRSIHEHHPQTKLVDLLFLHCGGKDRIPTVNCALSKVGVPVTVVVDFDILNDGAKLKELVEFWRGMGLG